ncbi:kinesin-like protein KIN-12D isoform X1 [Lactuca sativa]|uniref:kinesin-like protein KIN-12D isoform X1 n=1 Tax=Lactuca sativa TaxID=4236 RepID=UPI000CD8C634|nr:kinesin-like protein KIN-12D isoform X1 [Lactuca sativa]
MLRDLKLLRRNSGKSTDFDEPENMPVNGKFHESSASQMGTDSSSRPPLNAIRDPVQNPGKRDQELGFKSSKLDRTPTKVNTSKHSESGMPMKTPEKQGGLARNRYGWGSDSRVEGKSGTMNMNMNTNTPRSCRTVGRALSSGYSECNSTQNTQSNSTQNTPTKSVNKPPNPGLSQGVSSRPPISGGVRSNGSFAALSRGLQNTYTTVNTVEVPHIDLKEDPSFWMDHNVQVLIRIRPLNNMELSAQGYNRCLKQESAQCLTWLGHPETRFTFDHVACETIDQETLFRMVGLPMVENCLSGYNSCIFAYGQTGSGKTHTMLGEINELDLKPSPQRGMTPRMFEFLFARIIAEEESRMDERLTYNCKCSFLEIYNEQITDLLDPSSTNLQLREDVKKGVYVENLTECEVHTVGDILRLLSRGSANRRVAATNMNRESSRSHSVFTCVIESRWEKDSTSNLRFARLNLVDLAGSERQKTSGAEGERLKEAANINKSLSTLGHVIMVLVDGANARTRHVPYRDSRLTFLLQDSLGGNSKTMIIANVSPSICSATETLNTLKFAQRAKLIQNNAVVNEDASGDIMVLQQQIQLLKEELAILKRNNISRSLAFGPKVIEEATQEQENDCNGHDNKILKVSSKQLKSLETSLTGALRREQMSEASIKQLEAEIEQLNRLVRQREDDNKCTKMMLKFREDKIHRMKSLLAGSMPADSYMLEENNMLIEEIQMLRAKVDRNPEVTRFALENIRLLEQLRRFQDFYEEGEREMLLKEVSEMRNQLVLFLDENKQHDQIQKEAAQDNKENNSVRLELQKSQEELEMCRNNLNSCLERNEKLCREIADLNALLENQKSIAHDHGATTEVIKDPIIEAASVGDQSLHTIQKREETHVNYIEEVMNLQLEVDILKTLLKEESSSRGEIVENLKSTEEKYMLITKQYTDLKEELEEAKSVIEALEIQQLVSINEVEALRNSNDRYAQILHEKELKKDTILSQESQDRLNKMKDSLEKARRTNNWYKTDKAFQASNEEEMDEVRKQVEAETAEVIVCLQEEVCSLQQQLDDSIMKEREIKSKYEEKERQLSSLSEEWQLLSDEIHDALTTGHETLEDISHDLDDVTIFDQLQMITRSIFEKESRIKELNACLEDAKNRGNEMEGLLRSLRGATMVMTEAHQEDCSKKDRIISQLIKQNKQREEQIKKASACATVAFVIVNRFSEMKDSCLEALTQKEAELEELKRSHIVDICEAKKKKDLNMSRRDDTISLLKKELETALGSLNGVKSEMARLHSEKESVRLSEKQNHKSIETLMHQVMALQSVVDYFENQIGGAMGSLDHKIQTVEELLQESCKSCSYKRKLYELELMDAKVNAAEHAAESFCVLAKFEEAHYTIKEADVMINELVIANETMKLDIEALKKKEVALVNERDTLKENYEEDIMGMKKEVRELEGMIMEIQSLVDKDLMPTVSDLFSMKSHLHDSSKLIHSWLEDIWSEIIMKDCAVSVLHVCHMGILLQTVTGLNAENGLLQHGLCESNSLVSQLKDHNLKSRKELEMCRVVQGKLLADIKNSFDHVSKSTEETGVLSMKLASFEKRILSLQLQEEAMVERSNYMGSELSALVKEMNAMDKDEELRDLEEKFMVDLFVKEIELLIVSSALNQMDSQRMDLEHENNNMFMVLEKFKENMIMVSVDMQFKDASLLDKEAELLIVSSGLSQMDLKRKDLENENNKMFMVLEKFKENMVMANVNMQSKDSILLEKEAEVAFLNKDVKEKENELLIVSSRLEQLDSQRKDLENENNRMLMVLEKFKENMIYANMDIQLKDSILLEKEAEVAFLQKDVKAKEIELLNVSSKLKQIDSRRKILENENNSMFLVLEKFKENMIYANMDIQLKDSILMEKEAEVAFLQKDVKAKEIELLNVSSKLKQIDSQRKILENENNSMFMVLEKFEENMIITNVDMQLKDSILNEVISENMYVHSELERKDEVVEGLVFDLQLLQESSSKTQDQKDEIEELEASLEALAEELDENIVKGQVLEGQVKEKVAMINALEADVSRERELVKSLFSEIQTLKDALKAHETTGMELAKVKEANESMEMELVELGTNLVEMETLVESRTCELLEVRKELEMTQALAEENEAIATESKQIAETSRLYAEEKEEEVKLYEKSVEELDCMVTVLENQVDMVKGDAERQRLQREELELEFHAFKQQINQVKTSDSDIKRALNEKEKSLQESLQRVELLEKEIANKDKEIVQHKAHISELNLHAEAQAKEYKQTFKALEAMAVAEQVKSDVSVSHISNSPSKKLEKNGSRTRGSGSPFKCIGIGLAQQMKSERDEELTTARKRIEELEALAASRQKEIFALNAKLAMSGSMTHDVLRDLLGIKMDMTTYSSLIDGNQIEEITEKARIHNAEAHFQEEEVIKLKEQLNELVMERKGWLEEIERKQSELITAEVALEQLRQRDRLLKTENEMFKTEIANHKMKVLELEAEVKKLSGQQNIQQRIHHHMKIKEENNSLKNQNDELIRKLRRSDEILCRVKEELANLRAKSGNEFSDVETELQIHEKLKGTEEERDLLAQKLAALCTSILKVAGITRPTSDVSISMAEEALEQLQGRVATLERELQDLQHKNRISNERVRLSEMMPQRVEENRPINNSRRTFRSPFLTSLDR